MSTKSTKTAKKAAPNGKSDYYVNNCNFTAEAGKVTDSHAMAIQALAGALGKNADALAEAARSLQVKGGNFETGIRVGL